MGNLQSIKLKRQQYAYLAVKGIQDDNKSDYKSMVESLGMMIYHNGLVSTLSQLKKKEPEIYTQIHKWITSHPTIGFNFNGHIDLLDTVLKIENPMTLNALTLEILSLTDALKEIIKAEIE